MTMSPSTTAIPSTSAYCTPLPRNVAPSSNAVPAIGPDRHSPEPLPWLLLLRPPPVAAVLRPAVDFRGAAFFVRRGDSDGLAFMVNLVKGRPGGIVLLIPSPRLRTPPTAIRALGRV